MRILVTSGPSFEPIDKVRRLTNFSTGELGTLLADSFAAAGHSVIAFRGTTSTFPPPQKPVDVIPFDTNNQLAAGLRQLAGRENIHVIFHVAALTDFRVREIVDNQGEPLSRGKFSSREPLLKLTLEPAPKVIATLRRLFPASLLVGWKYELEGTRDQVMAKGLRQIDDYLTDVCVLNGTAYGSGFGILARLGEQAHLPDKPALCRFFVDWLERTPVNDGPSRVDSFHPLATFVPLAPFI